MALQLCAGLLGSRLPISWPARRPLPAACCGLLCALHLLLSLLQLSSSRLGDQQRIGEAAWPAKCPCSPRVGAAGCAQAGQVQDPLQRRPSHSAGLGYMPPISSGAKREVACMAHLMVAEARPEAVDVWIAAAQSTLPRLPALGKALLQCHTV